MMSWKQMIQGCVLAFSLIACRAPSATIETVEVSAIVETLTLATDVAEYSLSSTPSAVTQLVTATASQVVTYIPSLTPSVTATAQPELTAHEFQPGALLIWFSQSCAHCFEASFARPHIVLYSNGLLIRTESLKDHEAEAKYTYLDSSAICQILNTIEQTGFLDYDPAGYNYSPTPGNTASIQEKTDITVHAWKTNSVGLVGLQYFLTQDKEAEYPYLFSNCDDCYPPPVIPPALEKINRFLLGYDWEHAYEWESYRTDHIRVQFDGGYGESAYTDDWPIENDEFDAFLMSRGEINADYFWVDVQGELADEWARQLDHLGSYRIGNRFFSVGIMYEYPHIEALKNSDLFLGSPKAPLSDYQSIRPISCSPSDGTLPIP